MSGTQTYLTSRVLQRVRELRREGRDPRDIFEAHDLDRTGLVAAARFREIVSKLQLLQTEGQLNKAVEDCIYLSDKLEQKSIIRFPYIVLKELMLIILL